MKDSVGRITAVVGLLIAFSPAIIPFIWLGAVSLLSFVGIGEPRQSGGEMFPWPLLMFVTIPVGLVVYLVGRAIGSSEKNPELVNTPKSPWDVSGRGWVFWLVVMLGTILFITILTNLFEKPPVQY